jgi:hypothetical protein
MDFCDVVAKEPGQGLIILSNRNDVFWGKDTGCGDLWVQLETAIAEQNGWR